MPPIRSSITFLLIGFFGAYCSMVLGHFGARQMIGIIQQRRHIDDEQRKQEHQA